jgi:hypothetical protein
MDQKLQSTQGTRSPSNQALRSDSSSARPRKTGRPSKRKEQDQETLIFRALKQTIVHFLGTLLAEVQGLPEHRQLNLLHYKNPHFFFWVLSLYLTHQGSCHQQGHQKGNEKYLSNFKILSGCTEEELACADTVVGFFKRFDPIFLERAWAKAVQSLIRSKAIDFGRHGGRFLLAIDATGYGASDRPYDDFCLTRTYSDDSKSYHRSALVAFIVLEEGFAIPIAVQFIENMEPNASKQDCEIKAFHRIAKKIKGFFPQTPFWLLGDALYADQNVIRTCQKYGWGYSINFKESDLPALWRDCQELLVMEFLNKLKSKSTAPNGKFKTQVFQWVNQVDYYGIKLSATFLAESESFTQEEREALEREGKEEKITHFAWITHQAVDRESVAANASVGRQRWRCENEGFNVLKNGGFNLEHAYTRNRWASQCFFVMMMMAHTIQQLYAKGSLLRQYWSSIGTLKNLAKLLSQAFATSVFTEPILPPAQIRLRPDH